jgi:hypothetical protein
MSLDRRLRSELERDAERVVPDVERNLGAVEARARGRSSVGTPALLFAAAVIALAIALRLGAALPPSGGPSPAPSGPSASAVVPATSPLPSFGAIAGTYVVTLDPAVAAIARDHLGGTWTMRLAADGEIFLSPPATFGSGTSSLSGLAFTLAGDRFRSNIFYNDFCNSIGTYTWSLQAGRLAFAPVDETCVIRQELLSTIQWQVGP